MKRFRFRLQTLLDYRRRLEKITREEYQFILAKKKREEGVLKEMVSRREMQQRFYSRQLDGGTEPRLAQMYQDYFLLMTALIHRQRNYIDEVQQEVRKRFDAWNRRRRELRVLRDIRARKWREYLADFYKSVESFQNDMFLAKRIREGSHEEKV